ncbi:MAG: GtrA family protein [candidate division KSB1 bacterium]|nr:GtrA family protein [candidate division KSB1 bacterium]
MGVLNSLIDALLYLLLTRATDLAPLPASALSFLTGSVNSFLLNKRFTFVDETGGAEMARQYVRFFCVTLLVLGVHQLSLLWWYHLLALPDVFAKACGMAAGVLLGFRLNRNWVFGLKLPMRQRRHLPLPSLPAGQQ